MNIAPFHWVHSNWKVREKFVRSLRKGSFAVKIAVAKNPVKIAEFMEDSLAHLIIEKNIQKIIIDDKKPKLFERRFNKVLRDKGVSAKQVSTADDHRQPSLRVADAFAGLARMSIERPLSPAVQMQKIVQIKVEIILNIK